MKIKSLCIALLVAGLFSSNSVFSKDIPKETVLTTEDGRNFLLKDDNTWILKNGKKDDIEKDFTVPLGNGKIILIVADGSWGYVNKELVYAEDEIKADSVVGQGHAIHADVAVASGRAQKEAFDQVVSKTKLTLKSKKLNIDMTKVADCVRRVEKETDNKETHKNGVGWDATYYIKLDKQSLLVVADCAKKPEKVADSTKAVAADSVKQ